MEAINVQWDKNILELENTYLQQHEQLVDTKIPILYSGQNLD
jgi:hypothetical protein